MDANTKHPHDPRGIGHETTDVNIWAVGKFGVALVTVTLLSIGLLIGVFQFFLSRETASDKAIDPLKVFPSPQLLQNEPRNLAQYRATEDQVLNGYAWVDPKNGVVRIPVDLAIDVLARKGLPVRQQTASPASNVSLPTESGLGEPQQKPQEETSK
ncbi:MAG: hypothetical protein JST11_18330 [Acidobacteria bacterium]|nr:hypothetical protein [Acidobacteriota bacterium]